MKIDNREQIKELLLSDFEKYHYEYIFYVVQVLLRKKDGCDKDNYPVYQKIIDKPEKIDHILDDAVYYAEKYNGRVYITISPKIKSRVALKIAKKFIDYIDDPNFNHDKSFESIIYSTSMLSGNSIQPRIIFDFDYCDINDDILKFFNEINLKYQNNFIYLQTVSGFHVICDMTLDYMNDEFINLIPENIKTLIKDIYVKNNNKAAVNFKQAFRDMMHKESGNALVYYKK